MARWSSHTYNDGSNLPRKCAQYFSKNVKTTTCLAEYSPDGTWSKCIEDDINLSIKI